MDPDDDWSDFPLHTGGQEPQKVGVPQQSSTTSDAKPSLGNQNQQPSQMVLEEFWAKFHNKYPGKVSAILPTDTYTKKAEKHTPKGTIKEENALKSYDEAARLCKEKVQNIVEECQRLNCKYSDPDFDIEDDLRSGTRNYLHKLNDSSFPSFRPKKRKHLKGPRSVRRVGDIFEDAKFFINGATPNDVRQGAIGDCWFLAALCAMGNMPGLIEKVCVVRDEGYGVYGFVFSRDREWFEEIIDDKLYLKREDYNHDKRRLGPGKERTIMEEQEYRKTYRTNSHALNFAQCEDPNETWLPLLEKAYAKAHGDFDAIHGGFSGEALEDVTGSVPLKLASWTYPTRSVSGTSVF